MSFPILTALIAVPAVGALVIALLSQRRPEWIKLTAVLVSTFTGAISIWVLSSFETGDAGFQFVSKHPWIRQWGISWHLGIDGISLFLVVLTGILFPLVILGIDPHHDHKRYLAWLLLLEAGMMGSFNVRFTSPGDIAELYMPGADGPLWWLPWEDKVRGRPAWGLLSRCMATSTCPKIMETYGGPEACFGAYVLDRDSGHFRLNPSNVTVPAGRRYLPGTMVLETTWGTRTGWVIVRDVLLIGPWHHETDRSHTHRRPPTDWDADHVLLRTLRCVNGSDEMAVDCKPVMEYGTERVTWEYSGEGYSDLQATAAGSDLTLTITTDLRLGISPSALADILRTALAVEGHGSLEEITGTVQDGPGTGCTRQNHMKQCFCGRPDSSVMSQPAMVVYQNKLFRLQMTFVEAAARQRAHFDPRCFLEASVQCSVGVVVAGCVHVDELVTATGAGGEPLAQHLQR